MTQKGYTLVEMVVVVGLTALLGVAIVAMFLSTARGGGKSGALARVKEEGEYAISTMERQVRFASSIENPACDGTNDDNFQILLNDGSDITYRFDSSVNQVFRTVDSDPETAVTSAEVVVSNFNFTCIQSGGTIKATISFEMGITREAINETFTSSVVLRNTN